MQTTKSKASPVEVPSRSSPKTPRTARLIKTPGSGSEQVSSSPNKAQKVNKDRSPRVIERRTSQSPESENKRQPKASDLESEIVQLKEDLKQAKDKTMSSDLLKEQAELEAEDAKKQLTAMTAKLEETEKQLIGISDKEKSRVQELCKTSQDGDAVLVPEVEVGELELGKCKKSEAQVLEKLNTIQSQLEAAMEENAALKLSRSKAVDYNNTVASEFEESKAKVKALEILLSKLQSNSVTVSNGENGKNEHLADDTRHCQENGQNEETEQLKSEIMNLKYEDCKLRAALEAAEMRYQEVRLQTTLEVRSAYEQVENKNLDLRSKEAELQMANSYIKELQTNLAEKELFIDAEKDQRRQLEIHLTSLQETSLKKDILLQDLDKENSSLKQEVQKLETEKKGAAEGFVAISKFEYLTKESDKNSERTARVIEQLNAAQVANVELESELRKLKVQSDQWRKAAEAAAAMLTSGNNGKYVDRTGSLDSGYHTLGGRIGSPFSDDVNDEAVKKKNGNMLKKIGVLWKKGQNQK